MKKLKSAALCIVIIFATVSCSQASAEQDKAGQPNAIQLEDNTQLKSGLGMIAYLSDIEAPGDNQDGSIKIDMTTASVVLDQNEKIVHCNIDSVQAIVPYGANNEIHISEGSYFPTKTELGDNYGMKKASAIGKEWYEQAEAYSQWTIGKTIDEIKGIATSEADSDSDLVSSVTISTGNFIEVIEKAAANAK